MQPAGVHSHILASVGRGAHHSQIRNPARLSVVAMLCVPAGVGCLANRPTLHARVTSITNDFNGTGSQSTWHGRAFQAPIPSKSGGIMKPHLLCDMSRPTSFP